MEITMEEKSFIVHTLGGVSVGFISAFLSGMSLTGTQVLLFAVVILYGIGMGFRRGLKLDPAKYNFRWWLANGIYPYMCFWLFVWILLTNL